MSKAIEATKRFSTKRNIGKSKYVISYTDGSKHHSDGSTFWDVLVLNNKTQFNAVIKSLTDNGFIEE
jgi:hypothetical protein